MQAKSLLSRTLLIALGLALGLAFNLFLPLPVERQIIPKEKASVSPTVSPSPPGNPLDAELTAAKKEIAALKAEIAQLTSARLPESTPPPPAAPKAAEPPNEKPTPSAPNRIAWRISAIEKFVPLTDEQRERLTVKFERESSGDDSTESLDEILGGESAAFYREQVRAAFERAKEEEVDREIVWLSRQLALTPTQEQAIKTAFDRVETELDTTQLPASVGAKTPEERVKAMIAENKRREELRSEQLKTILSPDQFTAYTRTQAESSKSDIEVFHGEG